MGVGLSVRRSPLTLPGVPLPKMNEVDMSLKVVGSRTTIHKPGNEDPPNPQTEDFLGSPPKSLKICYSPHKIFGNYFLRFWHIFILKIGEEQKSPRLFSRK